MQLSEPIFNIYDTFLLAAAFMSALFVLLILFTKNQHRLSSYFLAGFFLTQVGIPIHLLIQYGEAFRPLVLETSPNLYFAFELAIWLEGPMLLFYIRTLLYKKMPLNRMYYLVFVPAICYAIYLYLYFYAHDASGKLAFILNQHDWVDQLIKRSFSFLREALRVLFGVLSLIEIRAATKQIQANYSDLEQIDIRWIKLLVVAFTAVRVWILSHVVLGLFFPAVGLDLLNQMGIFGNILNFALITSLMFLSLQRSVRVDGALVPEESKPKNRDFQADDALVQRIETQMKTDKPYLMHQLTLDQLSDKLGIQSRQLSETINRHFKTNFCEFVNAYRIEEAKSILSNPNKAHMTMIDVSEVCGFNSKATYNTFFKKLVKLTPTQYKKEQLNKAAS